jgi:hypothetical protein
MSCNRWCANIDDLARWNRDIVCDSCPLHFVIMMVSIQRRQIATFDSGLYYTLNLFATTSLLRPLPSSLLRRHSFSRRCVFSSIYLGHSLWCHLCCLRLLLCSLHSSLINVRLQLPFLQLPSRIQESKTLRRGALVTERTQLLRHKTIGDFLFAVRVPGSESA